jgi:6-phosphogluconolactonase (cycloisomerase 2 family)
VGRIVVGLFLLVALAAPAAHGATIYATSGSVVYSLGTDAAGNLFEHTPAFYSQPGLVPEGAVVAPDGLHLYVASNEEAPSNGIGQFAATLGGALTPLTPAKAAATRYAIAIAVSPDGGGVYATASGGTTPRLEPYSVNANGTLKRLGEVSSGNNGDVVMTPDGLHLYSGIGYSVGADRRLTPISGVSAPADPYVVSPDGRFLFGFAGSSILVWGINSDGTLISLPSTAVGPNFEPQQLAIAPDGSRLYAAGGGTEGGLMAYSIGPLGTVTPLTTEPEAFGTPYFTDAISPDGRSLYAANTDGLRRFAIGPDGELTATPSLLPIGSVRIFVAPDQGPTAAFSVGPAAATVATTFDAAASSDPDGTVASYAWNFGDGVTTTTGSPTVTHVYAGPGNYTASLTVTDAEGVSTQRSYNGHQLIWNGGPRAATSHPVAVGPAPTKLPGGRTRPRRATISKLKVKPNAFAIGSPKAKHRGKGPKRGAFVSFKLDAAGTVTERVTQRLHGHRHGGKCSAGAKTGKRCIAFKPLRGSVKVAGKKGTNRFAFSGRFAGKALAPGVYRLVLSPAGGRAATAEFTILR